MSEILSFDAMKSLELSAFFIGSVTLIILGKTVDGKVVTEDKENPDNKEEKE